MGKTWSEILRDEANGWKDAARNATIGPRTSEREYTVETTDKDTGKTKTEHVKVTTKDK